jgi:hypothetical protein
MCNKTSTSFATAHASQKQDKAKKTNRTEQKKKRKKGRKAVTQLKKIEEEKSKASTNDSLSKVKERNDG